MVAVLDHGQHDVVGRQAVRQCKRVLPGYVGVLRALEDALEDYAGCAVIISHDRWFLDRLATHILAFEDDSHVEWFEGNFEDYEKDKIRRLGPDSVNPKRPTYKRLTR